MTRRVEFLAIVPRTNGDEVTYHAYFYCKCTRQIVDIQVNEKIVDFLVKHSQGNPPLKPTVTGILKKLNVKRIVLATNDAHEVTALVRIRNGHFNKDYIFPLYTGFLISTVLGIPMEVGKKTLEERGIYVTKELLKASLA